MSFEFNLDPKERASAEFMTSVHNVLSREISRVAKERGVSRSKIARLLGVDRSVVTRALNGKTNLTIRTISDICWAIGVEPDFSAKEDSVKSGCNHVNSRFVAHEQMTAHNPKMVWSVPSKPQIVPVSGRAAAGPSVRTEQYAG